MTSETLPGTNATGRRPAISLVLPCYNEGPGIASALETVTSWFGEDIEILVMDDGSVDDTVRQAQTYAADHAHVFVHRLPRHRGKGGALRAAMPLVRGELVVFMDADLAYDRASVQRTLDGLATADLVIGNRRLHGSRYSVPVSLFGFLFRRHVAGLLFNAFVRAATGVTSRDTQCGLKGLRRGALQAVARALSMDGFAFDVEMLLVARALGFRIAEVPVNVRYESARSSVTVLLSGRAMVLDIAKIAVRRARGLYSPARLRKLSGVDASPGAGEGSPLA